MDAFFASVEERENPDLNGKPVIVVGSASPRSVVCAANYEVRKFGVHSAMPYTQAIRLCPQAEVITAKPGLYRETSRRIFSICEQFTDLIEISSIDECYMNMTPTAERFGGAVEAARALKRRIRDAEKLTCTIGIGPSKMLAKLIAGMKKPDGLSWTRVQDVPRLLESLPISAMHGIGDKTASKLKAIGITTAGDLRRVDRSALRRMFGRYGDRLADMGQGIDDSPVVPYYDRPLPKSISRETTLDSNTRDPELIKRTLRYLSEDVAARLRREGLSAKTVGITVRFDNLQRITRSATLIASTDDGLNIYYSILPLLDEALVNPRPVRLIGVSTANLAQCAIQHGLFDDPRRRRLTEAVDALNEKMGKRAVRPASLLNTNHNDNITFRG
jgi:DNA polymerase IV